MVLMEDMDIALIVVDMYICSIILCVEFDSPAFVVVVAECAIVNIHTLLLKYQFQTPKKQV